MNPDRSRMKAAIYRRYGPPDVVQIVDVPRPDIKATEMLVKVRATTVTAGDSRLRSARVPRGFANALGSVSLAHADPSSDGSSRVKS